MLTDGRGSDLTMYLKALFIFRLVLFCQALASQKEIIKLFDRFSDSNTTPKW
jgi:hypothetical protein